jgi:hypothetical protein
MPNAKLGAKVDRYSFFVRLLPPLLHTGLARRTNQATVSQIFFDSYWVSAGANLERRPCLSHRVENPSAAYGMSAACHPLALVSARTFATVQSGPQRYSLDYP